MVIGVRIAVCDDQQHNLDIVKSLWNDIVDGNFKYEYIELNCAEDLLYKYKNGEIFDLLVLDIEMGDISGMEAARRIRRIDKNVKIIFITAYEQYIREAFDVAAMYFLDKPVDEIKLKKLFRQCIREYREQNYALYFTILTERQQEETVKLPIKDVLYIESYMRYVIIHTIDNREYKTKGKISEYEKELCSRNFIRTHMSFLVNIRYIIAINKEVLKLKHEQTMKELPLSRKQKTLVESVFLDYKVGDYKL